MTTNNFIELNEIDSTTILTSSITAIKLMPPMGGDLTKVFGWRVIVHHSAAPLNPEVLNCNNKKAATEKYQRLKAAWAASKEPAPKPGPIKWEYNLIATSRDSHAILKMLDLLGEERWELISTDRADSNGEPATRLFFKRQLPANPSPV
jgi:hypothetical protein